MHSTPPTSIEPPDDKAVIELISPDRLNPYLTACAGDSAAALALYRWNSDLVAAFFEPLGHLEIMLRNALDARLVAASSAGAGPPSGTTTSRSPSAARPAATSSRPESALGGAVLRPRRAERSSRS
ncbi:hypothetical protein [Streptomyces viridosporus]|uniref:hypothetical protein n=1 Tax=Streptomyces viridosporus TaxID=67581 RepID=UPI0036F96AE3